MLLGAGIHTLYCIYISLPVPVFSYKLRHIVGFGLVEIAISTNPKPTIYRNGPWDSGHKNTKYTDLVVRTVNGLSLTEHTRQITGDSLC